MTISSHLTIYRYRLMISQSTAPALFGHLPLDSVLKTFGPSNALEGVDRCNVTRSIRLS